MNIITILLFFVYCYALGYILTFFISNQKDPFEKHLMRIGIGLGVLTFLIIFLNFLHIPIDWKIFLIISISALLYMIWRNRHFKIPSISLTYENLRLIIVLVIFSLTLFMYVKGAFIYPYFEDDDPWAHAAGVKYVSIEKNLNDENSVLKYIKPYPPAYDAILAILHQTSSSIMWTMKFFNALIISLGIIFFYYFSRSFMHSSKKALLSTFVLAMVPSYLSHFIWAHSLAITLFIVSLYCILQINKDIKWSIPSMFVIAGICMTQPSQAIKFFVMFMIFVFVKAIYDRKLPKWEFFSIIGGYILSLIWWAENALATIKGMYTSKGTELQTGLTGIAKLWDMVKKAFPPTSGTATRSYTFNDFFIAKSQNMINNPVGVGIVLCLLALFSLFLIFITYKSMNTKKKTCSITASLWLIFTFLGINTMTFHLPIGLFAFRFWMLFAIPLSIIAAEGLWFLVEFFKQFRILKIATITLLVILIFFTSGKQKYDVNTAMWGPGQMWTSMDEVMGYVWLKNLPPNTKVFAYSGDEQVIGFDKFSCLWCNDVIDFRKDLLHRNASQVYSWLKRNRYEYLIVDGMAYKNFESIYGVNETNELLSKRLEEINSLGKFQVAHQTKGIVVFKVL